MRKNECRTFVLDTLFDYYGMPPNSSGDPNQVIMALQTPLLQMVREENYSGFVTGHAPKSEASALVNREPEEAFSGNTAWTAQHRMRAYLGRHAQGVTSIVTGRGGYGDQGILTRQLLRFDEETRLDFLDGSFAEHQGEAAIPSVMRAIKEHGKPISLSKLTLATGKSEGWLSAGLKAGAKARPQVIFTNAAKGNKFSVYWTAGMDPPPEKSKTGNTQTQLEYNKERPSKPRKVWGDKGEDLDAYGIPKGK